MTRNKLLSPSTKTLLKYRCPTQHVRITTEKKSPRPCTTTPLEISQSKQHIPRHVEGTKVIWHFGLWSCSQTMLVWQKEFISGILSSGPGDVHTTFRIHNDSPQPEPNIDIQERQHRPESLRVSDSLEERWWNVKKKIGYTEYLQWIHYMSL